MSPLALLQQWWAVINAHIGLAFLALDIVLIFAVVACYVQISDEVATYRYRPARRVSWGTTVLTILVIGTFLGGIIAVVLAVQGVK